MIVVTHFLTKWSHFLISYRCHLWYLSCRSLDNLVSFFMGQWGQSLTLDLQKVQAWEDVKTKTKNPAYGKHSALSVCVVKEHRFYTMSLSQYHGCYQYHECYQYHKSISKPWVLVNTMSACLYHESMTIPYVHVYTMSPCLYQESMTIP